jgi:hypothetical protein
VVIFASLQDVHIKILLPLYVLPLCSRKATELVFLGVKRRSKPHNHTINVEGSIITRYGSVRYIVFIHNIKVQIRTVRLCMYGQ